MSSSRGLIVAGWTDAWGRHRAVSDQTHDLLSAAMGDEPAAPSTPARDPVRLVRGGDPLDAPGHVLLEDGSDLGTIERLPPDLPLGYHRLTTDAGEQLLIAAPPHCHLPDDLRTWGWSVQLPTTRSRRSWGIGDLEDLRELAAWSNEIGAGILQVSPLGSPNPGPKPEASPYFPSTRRFRSLLHLAVGRIPGAERMGDELAPLASSGEALNAERLVDRERVLALKLQALELLWASVAATTDEVRRGIDALRHELGGSLRSWAVYAAIAERLGGDWRRWPDDYRDPDGAAAARLADEMGERVAFHEWVQWLLDEQLRAAGSQGPGLVQDLPIGFDPGGFDAWSWQAQLAQGAWLGAPPDLLGPDGQDWGLSPFVPHRLRAAGYRPYIETLRSGLRHSAGLRIDHAAGLFRGWWVPAGHPSSQGAYVRYPSEEMLAILALESLRAGAWIVGEDLGTLEEGVRERLAERRILSMRVVYFEEQPPAAFPRHAMALLSTHDLPTLAGLWSGSDLADQERAGVAPDPGALATLRGRLQAVTGLPGDAEPRQVILAAHAALSASPSAVVTATLEDALAEEERVNVPGTVAPQRANWSLSLALPIEELRDDPFVASLAAALGRDRPLR
ncbi:MAG: 4-alpha-glucanotransferase [Chloroflexota bacterium]|nr:4-alpha-glucanotransferase [Chloroflexota bacterium]